MLNNKHKKLFAIICAVLIVAMIVTSVIISFAIY
jgi:hypothetical protein